MTHPHPNRRFVPQAVLTRSGKINTAGVSVNTAVRPVNTAGSKPTVNHPRSISNAYKKGYSQVTRPFNKYSANKNSIFNKKVNTVRVKDTTARDRAVVSKNKGKGVNAVKASACWGNPQQKEYKEKGVIDSGCSRHMTGNKCYLTEYKDYDGGFFPLEMELKYNLFSAFLYGTIEEEVYVCQPPGFEDPHFLDKVYKVYVDDIIFGSTKKSLCDEFEGLMHKRFQMSSMGELTFFLGLQVQQKKNGIFISQDKYVADILKKFDFATMKTTSTPIEPNKALIKDEKADSMDVHLYRSMIGSLLYLIASKLDIM
ncbi:putative ribonuclease H-like domain-containing protein, partial [Tanacetum coccineum]